MRLTRLALENPLTTAFAYLVVAALGVLAATNLRVHLLPDVSKPYVYVTAQYPGASSEELERLVVRPLEDTLLGIENGERISATIQGDTATIELRFALDSDVDTELADVRQRVENARAYLPDDLTPPAVVKDLSTVVLRLAITSRSLGPVALGQRVREEVVPALRSVPGVLDVALGGAARQEFHVYPDRNRLAAVRATTPDVAASIALGNANQPGGRFEDATNETLVSLAGNAVSASDVAALPLVVDATPVRHVRVGDVARVEDGLAERRQLVRYDNEAAVDLTIVRAASGDTLRVTDAARRRIVALARTYPSLALHEIATSSDNTRSSIVAVIRGLLEGVTLTALAMLLFLRDWRNAVIVALAIPLSVLAALIAMRAFGMTVDLVSMLGLGLTVGVLVDDSIVVLENITRRRDAGDAPLTAAIEGRREIGRTALAITAVDVVVFAPIIFIGGEIGKYLHEFAAVVVVATAVSLLVSFTLTPMLAGHWSMHVRRSIPERPIRPAPGTLERCAGLLADRVVPVALRYRIAVFAASIAAVAASLWLVPAGLIATDFVPFSPPSTVHASVRFPPGTPLVVTDATVRDAVRQLRAISGVAGVLSRTGAAQGDETDEIASNVGELIVVPARRAGSRDAVLVALRSGAVQLKNGTFAAGGGEDAREIAFTLTGPDAALDEAARRLMGFLAARHGASSVRDSFAVGPPEVTVRTERGRAEELGVSPGDVAVAARIASGSYLASRIRTPDALVDVRVLEPTAARTRAGLGLTTVRASDGRLVPLADVVRFEDARAPAVIRRVGGKRVIDVTADLDAASGVPLGDVVGPVDRALAQPGFLPADVRAVAEGDVDLFGQTLEAMRGTLIASAVLVLLVLVVLYGALLEASVVLLTLPFALAGALVALALRGQTLNLFSLVAIVMLFGLVGKNAILFVDLARARIARGENPYDAVRFAVRRRLRPILMTVAAMVLGTIPLAISAGEGAADRSSMGTVLIGGLLASLALTLIVVPVVYIAAIERFAGGPRTRTIAASEPRAEPVIELSEPKPDF